MWPSHLVAAGGTLLLAAASAPAGTGAGAGAGTPARRALVVVVVMVVVVVVVRVARMGLVTCSRCQGNAWQVGPAHLVCGQNQRSYPTVRLA